MPSLPRVSWWDENEMGLWNVWKRIVNRTMNERGECVYTHSIRLTKFFVPLCSVYDPSINNCVHSWRAKEQERRKFNSQYEFQFITILMHEWIVEWRQNGWPISIFFGFLLLVLIALADNQIHIHKDVTARFQCTIFLEKTIFGREYRRVAWFFHTFNVNSHTTNSLKLCNWEDSSTT